MAQTWAELLTSNPLDFNHEKNPQEQPAFFPVTTNTFSLSLRNSEYNQEKILVVPIGFFMFRIKRIGRYIVI